MNTSKKRVLTEQVRRLRARFAQSVDRLLGEVIPAELLKQWVLEEVVQWRERLNRQVMCRLRKKIFDQGLAQITARAPHEN